MDFITILLNAVSPPLRKDIVEFVQSLKGKTSNAKNPLDKIIVGIFIKMLDIKE